MHSILLLPLVVRCIETIDVCMWRMFVSMPIAVTAYFSGTAPEAKFSAYVIQRSKDQMIGLC